MARIVADTSALVSLGTVAEHAASPLDGLLDAHAVVVPERVLDELADTADYDDPSGRAARAVLDRRSAFAVRSTDLDEEFPLDDGENAAVTLANDLDADQFLRDEFHRLALVHASLTGPRLVTSPSLLLALVRAGWLTADAAENLLETMSDARSWDENSYVARARATLRAENE